MSDATRLIHDYFEGRLSDDDREHLAHLIRTDPQVAAEFARWSMTTAQLTDTPADSEPSVAEARTDRPPILRSFSGAGPITYGLAAALLLTTAAVAIYFFSVHRTSNIEDRPSSPPIATLIESTHTVSYENDVAFEGGDYASGAYSIASGSAQFLLSNRVTVNLSGPTRLVMYHPGSVRLASGSAAFNVPPEAIGFTVHLPDESKIVDLGTAFRVHTDEDGRATVHVTEGRVKWSTTGPNAESLTIDAGQRFALTDAGFVDLGELAEQIANDPAARVAYAFDGLAGVRTIPNLATADGFDGVVAGEAKWVAGESSLDRNALDLDGRTGHVRIGDGAANPLAGAEDFTIMARVYWRGGQHWSRIFDTGHDEQRNMFITPYSSHVDRFAFAITVGGPKKQQRVESYLPMPLERWAHIAATRRGSVVTLYLDGEPVGVNRKITIPTADVLGPQTYIGRSLYTRDPYFNGRIDTFVLLSRALTEDEIRDHVAAVQNKEDPTTSHKETLR